MSLIEHLLSSMVAGFRCRNRLGFSAVESETAFQSYLDGALEIFGIEADETDRAVMSGVWLVYEPAMNQLRDADLSGVEPEPDADPSRAPR
jgi:hypothetical protein